MGPGNDRTVIENRHARMMDADGYWREARAVWYFAEDTPCIAGSILELLPVKQRGDPSGLVIQTKEGDVWTVVAHEARLLFELKKAKPVPGDRIRITYTGLAPKAAPGMNRAKLFTVELRRQGSQSQQRPDVETSGEVAASENVVGTGDKSSG